MSEPHISTRTLIARVTGDTISGEDYSAHLIKLGLNHREAGARMGVSRRTSYHWASKGAPKAMVAKL